MARKESEPNPKPKPKGKGKSPPVKYEEPQGGGQEEAPPQQESQDFEEAFPEAPKKNRKKSPAEIQAVQEEGRVPLRLW